MALELLGLLGDRREVRELCVAIELLLVLEMVLGLLLLLLPGPSSEDSERVAGSNGDDRPDCVLASARGRALDEIRLGRIDRAVDGRSAETSAGVLPPCEQAAG